MHRSLLKTVSVLAISLFVPVIFNTAALAQNYSVSNVDPYGYGTVPLPPPQPQLQPMMMPSFQAQQGYAPLNQYSGQYAPQYGTQGYASQGAVSYGQAIPRPVATAQYGVVPTYLPATRTSSFGTTTQQASSVGYVVNGSQPASAQPYGAAPNSQAIAVPPGSGYVQTQAYAYGGAAAPSITAQAQQPTSSAQYGAPSASVQPPSYQPPSITTPAITASVPVTTYPAPTYSAPVGSITASPNYDGAASYQPSYQVASNAPVSAPSYTAPNYGYQSATPADASPQYAQAPVVTAPVVTAPAAQPQVQTYSYGAQQPSAYPAQGYTTQTQIYSPSTAFAVQQDSYPQQAAAPSSDTSMALDPTTSSPWYLAIRSGLSIPQGASFNLAGRTWQEEFETGWQLGTAAGYEFKSFNSWLAPRAEIELTYDQALVENISTGATKFADPNAYGFVRSLDLMANGYLDFRANRYLSPYLGGGIGIGYSDFDRVGTGPSGVVLDDNDVGFVWQAMAGLGINLSTNAMVDFGYRYQQNTGLTLKAMDGTTSTTDFGKHVIMIGFRNNL